MRFFEHEGCRSGQCAWQQHGMACLIARELSNGNNHTAESRRADEILNICARLQDEAAQTRPPPTERFPENRPDLSGFHVGDCVSAKFTACPTRIEGKVLEVNAETGWLNIKQGGGCYGGKPVEVEKIAEGKQ